MTLISGRSRTPSVTFTRPNDTTAYAAGDLIGSATTANHQLTEAGEAGSLIQILSASITINRTTLPAGHGGLRLHLWDANPSAQLDNAAFAAVAADRLLYRGSLLLPTPTVIGGGFLFTFADYVGRPVRLTSQSLWTEIVTEVAFTPGAQTEYEIRLNAIEVGA